MSSRRQNKRQPKPGKSAGKRAPGRPSRYRAEFAEQAGKLCRLGATDKEMAEFFGVSVATFNNWKLRHREFLESLKRGKSSADAEVADRLYRRALGYSHPAVKIMQNKGAPVIDWLLSKYPQGQAIMTSGSFRQVEKQLWPALRVHQRGFRGGTTCRPLEDTGPLTGGEASTCVVYPRSHVYVIWLFWR